MVLIMSLFQLILTKIYDSFPSIIGLLIGSLIAFNVIIGDLVPSIFHNLSGVEVSFCGI